MKEELTEREQAIKNVLLEEMGKTTYAEKKNIIEKLDQSFINKEIISLQKKKKFSLIVINIISAITFIAIVAIIFEILYGSVIGIIVLGYAGTIDRLLKYNNVDKRIMSYRILSHF